MRILTEKEIENIALGASLLGTGGGGDPYIGKLMALNAIREYGPVTLLSPGEVPDDALVVPTAMIGAPAVMIEKIPNGQECIRAFEAMGKLFGKPVFATMPIEAGGVNSMIPIAVAAQMRIPLVDGDGMGRAFPELQMVTYHLNGISAAPMTMTDDKGNNVLLEVISNKWAENIARNVAAAMGAWATVGIYAMSGADMKRCAIPDIMTYSQQIGEIISEAQRKEADPTDKLAAFTNGIKVFKGKMIDVERTIQGGFNRGLVRLDGLDSYKGQTMEVEFQNENLIARIDGEVCATTPDLICLVDLETAVPITTESLKYGRRATALILPAHELWRTPKGIENVGPRYFGYDYDYVPMEEMAKGRNS